DAVDRIAQRRPVDGRCGVGPRAKANTAYGREGRRSGADGVAGCRPGGLVGRPSNRGGERVIADDGPRADDIEAARWRRGIVMIDQDEGAPQRDAGFVLDSGMLLQKVGEELFFLQLAKALEILVVDRPDRVELAREQHLVEVVDQILLRNVEAKVR